MNRISKILSISSLLISIFSFTILQLNSVNNLKRSSATSDNTTIIGQFALVEPVFTRTKINISLVEKAFVENTGRIVYEENQVPGVLINGILPPPYQLKNYYYYADINSPKITEIATMRNDIESLVIMLQYLESVASSLPMQTQSRRINNVLGYIRSINLSYDDNFQHVPNVAWYMLTGSCSQTFIDIVEGDYSRGLRPNEFFASFLPPNAAYNCINDDNNSGHYSISDTYLNNNLNLYDENTGNFVDLIHMFASLDAIYDETTAIDLPNFSRNYEYFKDFASWAGDLNQTTQWCYNNSLTPTSFESILHNPNSCFSSDDFYADIDAYNIGELFLNNGESLTRSVYDYYSYYDSTDRIESFYQNCVDNYQVNVSGRIGAQAFLEKVYDCQSIKWLSDDSFDNRLDLGTNLFHHFLKSNHSPIPLNIRKQVAELFAEYIISNFGLE